jgi:2-polyprenyl-3-methyl-5-hydroxy-6-metoxy-1,4-benzoquinol methylase
MRVLDVACGTGNLAIPTAKAGVIVTGADIATNLLVQARACAYHEGIRNACGLDRSAQPLYNRATLS